MVTDAVNSPTDVGVNLIVKEQAAPTARVALAQSLAEIGYIAVSPFSSNAPRVVDVSPRFVIVTVSGSLEPPTGRFTYARLPLVAMEIACIGSAELKRSWMNKPAVEAAQCWVMSAASCVNVPDAS